MTRSHLQWGLGILKIDASNLVSDARDRVFSSRFVGVKGGQ